jgi:hypothetical protein
VVAVSFNRQSGTPIVTGDAVLGSKDNAVNLEQGWTRETQQAYYWQNQGSQIMRYKWFLALEQADSEELFRSDENMKSLRYLPAEAHPEWNPDGLPVGFVRDRIDAETSWLGLTCAACHTGEIAYKGQHIRIDGGQTLADVDAFDLTTVAALRATHDDEAKFARFAAKVLGEAATAEARTQLREDLHKRADQLGYRNEVNHHNSPDMPKYGYGRTDAIGQIFNKVMVHMTNMPENARASDAPVSYPFLWGSHQSNVVQWTGFAPNGPANLGALVRNGGEVLGVYGNLDLPADKSVHKYKSTIRVENIGQLEQWVAELRSPVWPESILPAIDTDLAASGAKIYDAHCAQCHAVVKREDQGMPYTAVLTSIDKVGTDSREYDNMVKLRAAGPFEGRKEAVLTGKVIGAETSALQPLINSVVGALLEHPVQTIKADIEITKGAITAVSDDDGTGGYKLGDITKSLLKNLSAFHKSVQELKTNSLINTKLPQAPKTYKARPLTGIWATAPYLHNGSVPNLKELLLPAARRSKTFFLGTREYDAEAVGYVDTPTFDGVPSFQFDTALPGNSNAGHEYGAVLSDAQRKELLEFLKTL